MHISQALHLTVAMEAQRGLKESKETVSQGDSFTFKILYSVSIWALHSFRFTKNLNFLWRSTAGFSSCHGHTMETEDDRAYLLWIVKEH